KKNAEHILATTNKWKAKNRVKTRAINRKHRFLKKERRKEISKKTYINAKRDLNKIVSNKDKNTIIPLTDTEKAAILQRLRKRLKAARQESGKAEGQGAIAVATTSLLLADKNLVAASPKAGGDPKDPAFAKFKPLNSFKKAQNHAEQGLVGKIALAIEDAKLKDEDLAGHTVFIHIEKPMCPICASGLLDSQGGAGVLKQFSERFPTLDIQVTAEGTSQATYILNQCSKQSALSFLRTKTLPALTLMDPERKAIYQRLVQQFPDVERHFLTHLV